jgi:small subunit ribosomal protein S13
MRILGINIPDKKQLEFGLTAVYGIGRNRAHRILDAASIAYDRSGESLSTEEENAIRKEAEEYILEGTLKRDTAENIKRLKDIQCYRGTRHARNLPVRGQRTKTNSRTSRGNKRNTMASGRIKTSKT